MQAYEKKQEPWRTSQGRMKEAAPKQEKENQRHLTGYAPSEQERNDKTAPFEVARLDSSFGDVAVGVTGENQLVYTTSQRRTEQGSAIREDEKSVRGDGVYRVSGTKNMAYTNPHDKSQSALAVRDGGEKAPAFMRKRFQGMVHRKNLNAAPLPFLDVEKDRKQKSALLQTEQAARRSGDSAQARKIANQRTTLGQVITEKEVQQRRFQQMLAKGQAQARAGKGTKWDSLRRGLVLEEETLDDADNPPEDEESTV